MATVRIYKVAELLGLSSQDAMDLLKKETGHRREERVELDRGDRGAAVRRAAGAEAQHHAAARPAVRRHAGREEARRQGGKAPEPPKPAAPVLRPRLVKAIKPAATEAGDRRPRAAEPHDGRRSTAVERTAPPSRSPSREPVASRARAGRRRAVEAPPPNRSKTPEPAAGTRVAEAAPAPHAPEPRAAAPAVAPPWRRACRAASCRRRGACASKIR